MNSKRQPRHTATTRRLRVAGVAVVAVLGLSACNSDPGNRRVAEDIVDTAFVQGQITQEVRDCLFDKLETYSDSDYEAITRAATDPGPGTALDLFEADLAACSN
ncbi:hypothetical protein [uncultured Ilumatobacter sp.]|uniref:hypothetical protein n=1 Tax=uncultured Ilumatobacter sp. TaxID=879968 RepID=UPI00374E50B8